MKNKSFWIRVHVRGDNFQIQYEIEGKDQVITEGFYTSVYIKHDNVEECDAIENKAVEVMKNHPSLKKYNVINKESSKIVPKIYIEEWYRVDIPFFSLMHFKQYDYDPLVLFEKE